MIGEERTLVTGQPNEASQSPLASAREVLRHHWGYEDFRPDQIPAIEAVLAKRDSLVVLPTGGGKSLCFQVPAMLLPGIAVVVSPLIALMKDQVDQLNGIGIKAVAINSTIQKAEKIEIARAMRAGEIKLVYLAPERLCDDRMLGFLESLPISLIAIDEAHCISQWGHDFRKEYRLLGEIRQRFPNSPLQALTATATPGVQQDIASQLHLRDPQTIVGNYDRPNLTYRVLRRKQLRDQVQDLLGRHKGNSGIIYCLSRKDVDAQSTELQQAGIRALPYHAGMSDVDRAHNQEKFLRDECDIVVATVAFGMGIDKSNVRFVLHLTAPKSLEHYQQEAGRAGRDGLPAECLLLYSPGDIITWKKLQENQPEDALELVKAQLREIEQFATAPICRHRQLVQHFGQTFNGENCSACDVCLGELAMLDDPLDVTKTILCALDSLGRPYGAGYVTAVLCGSKDDRISERGHQKTPVTGLLRQAGEPAVRSWIQQLVSQKVLIAEEPYGTLSKGPLVPGILNGTQPLRLTAEGASASSVKRKVRESAPVAQHDQPLFERLRKLRKELADEASVPPYIIFGDATLKALAATRPTQVDRMTEITGIGAKKRDLFGDQFAAAIRIFCDQTGLETDLFH